MRVVAIAGLCAFLSGCSTLSNKEALVTFETQPPGALLYDGDRAVGVAPKTARIKFKDGSQVAREKAVTAVWPSGATATVSATARAGTKTTIVISRPIDAPGLDIDLANANQLDQTAIAKRQADSANDAQRAAIAAQLLNQGQPKSYSPPPSAPPRSVNCTSYRDAGGNVRTDCF